MPEKKGEPVDRKGAAGTVAKPRRQTREERSAATRDKLLNGTYRLLLSVGHAGLRSANISQESGVSRGGLLHHFASKELLIAAVYEWTVQRLEDESWQRIEAAGDEELLEAIIADARQRFFSDSFKVILDILVASSEEEPLAETLKTQADGERAPAREGWAARLAAAGVEPELAGQVASFLWNTVKGLAVRSFVNDDQEHTERVIALAHDLAARRCNLPGRKKAAPAEDQLS
ncbi:TetR/AcrR family transcriptional regulator [Novosphingobium beihaiensis]|uniref:TetR/AcrR family transcriptional regulator n=1 Tax=Novosphingobium beihaiensis TaxID=2930389 RepID=A0ABT0BTQ6_9SPHN|nr:TetR/AcrR family transcriptional regulator [Novosphingobium beihaiensis]MCJ2188435.1 TetR/AcrR family transcriptional regulator [Novosphingobium beihaiensis]